MRRITAIEKHGHGEPCDTVRLDHDQRNRRRMVFTTRAGQTILLDMPRPVHLRDGDWLRLEDGAMVKVEAMGEPLIEISATSDAHMVRIAWHLGNRHLPTQLLPGTCGGTIRIRQDHVIAEMVAGLGGQCSPVIAPFDPEGGAYEGGFGHGHHHHDEDDHSHTASQIHG
ncbi:urease accessory protein UreE [Croceicoccus estronivorus]|uniref:urease accessory protein UreE n=1 Tax=Croceicoccus estronivorus TaxID=1172626 RepID=UPI0008341015|nr:urease accessory protein UreE [Croceicoccus estronivorus]OCC22391.1 urease accessory protein UreE [Croceicoccus estronivorus]